MKIRFKKGDPRAGLVAEFSTARGRELVEAGAAEEVRARSEAADEPEEKPAKPAKKAKKKAD